MSDRATPVHQTGKSGAEERPMRIGLVVTDPLRVLGLQQMLGGCTGAGTTPAEIVPLSIPGVLQDAAISNVFVDASCTDHLFELLTTFRRMRPQVRLIVVGDSSEPEYIQRVIGAGARGYVTQTALESEIRMALEIVNDGSVWAPRKVLARLLDKSAHFDDATEVIFTRRESEILTHLVTGLGNREIGEHLQIEESTVKAHVTRMMRKAGVKNRVELTLYALPRLGSVS